MMVKETLHKKYHRSLDPKVRETIILENLPLVKKVIHRFLGKGFSQETLYSVGCVALIHAVDRYDPTHRAQFKTYASAVISGEIKHYFRDHGWDVKVPRSLKEDYLRVHKEVDRLEKELGRSPILAEISKKLQISQERIIEAMEAWKDYQNLSLEAPLGEDDEGRTTNLLASIVGSDPRNENFIEAIDLRKAIKQLPSREQMIVEFFFFLEMTQQEIAKRLDISQIHVSRLLRRAVQELKKALV